MMTIGDILDVVKGKSAKRITGHPPDKCDLCDEPLGNHYPDEVPTCYDGRTARGPWAWMCRACFIYMGTGLGTGRGQKYEYSIEDKQWYKVEG